MKNKVFILAAIATVVALAGVPHFESANLNAEETENDAADWKGLVEDGFFPLMDGRHDGDLQKELLTEKASVTVGEGNPPADTATGPWAYFVPAEMPDAELIRLQLKERTDPDLRFQAMWSVFSDSEGKFSAATFKKKLSEGDPTALALRLVATQILYRHPKVLARVPLSSPPSKASDYDELSAQVRSTLPTNSAVLVDDNPEQLQVMRKKPDGSLAEFDVVVVGSGPSGATIAVTLREQGKSVLLLDAGSLIVPGSINPRMEGSLRYLQGQSLSEDGLVSLQLAQAVGGGATVNVDLAFPPTMDLVKNAFQQWKNLGVLPAGVNDDSVEAAYEWVENAIGTRGLSQAEINANNALLYNGAESIGLHPKLYRLNRYPAGKALSDATQKASPIERMILPAFRELENPLGLLSKVWVDQVVFERDESGQFVRDEEGNLKVQGLRAKLALGEAEEHLLDRVLAAQFPSQCEFIVPASKVVLCAGAIGSPGILYRSGIENENLGEGVVLHPSFPLIVRHPDKIDFLAGLDASVFVDDYGISDRFVLEAMGVAPNYLASMLPGSPADIWSLMQAADHIGGAGVMVVDEPSAGNRLEFDETGSVKIHYKPTAKTVEQMKKGLKTLARIQLASGAAEIFVPSFELGIEDSIKDENDIDRIIDRLDFRPGVTILSSAHMQATAKMGSSASSGVVDTRNRVFGTSGLWVVDASTVPTSVGANPMQTLYTLARIAAFRMGGEP